ncbi:MAG: hypothetical protein ABI806_03860 [Candidatus Solibacter sp.]
MRQPFRQAGRAAACIRRLERQLDPLRALAYGHGESSLLRQDERLAGIVNTITPFDALSSVLGRLGAKPDTGASAPRLYRRGLGAAVANYVSASGGEHETTTYSIAKVARPLPAAAGARAQSNFRKAPVQAGGHSFPSAASRVSAELPPAASAFIGARSSRQHQPLPVRDTAAAPPTRAVPFQPEITPQPQPGMLTAQQASAILAGRMQTVATRSAWSAPIRIANPSDAPNESQTRTAATGGAWSAPGRIASHSDAPSELQPRTAATRDATSSPSRIANHSAAPDESQAAAMPASSPAERAPGPHVSTAPSIHRPAASTASPARGLRRLAAMATESLDQPDPNQPAARPGSTHAASSTGNPAAPPDLRLDLELERILRDEAARYGIGPEGILG